jgi:hypothetical protein
VDQEALFTDISIKKFQPSKDLEPEIANETKV